MKLRPDFAVYISDLRHQEFAMIFGACPADLFDRALELGAGWRAIHSTLLATRARHVLSTDFKDAILEHTPSERIAYRVCDAEHVGDVFAPQSFDLIFSSNLLEHLPDLQGTLRGIHDVLTDDGITIHVMPSRFFKVLDMLGYLPRQVAYVVEGVTKPGGLGKLRKRLRGTAASTGPSSGENNLKLTPRRRSLVQKLVWPLPHGISATHRDEWAAFGVQRWKQAFAQNGFTVVAVRKGPVSSGHGFGLTRIRAVLERLGFTSEYAYIAVKSGHDSPYAAYFGA